MEGKVFEANLAKLDPMAKMVCRFGMRLEDMGGQPLALRSKIQQSKFNLI